MIEVRLYAINKDVDSTALPVGDYSAVYGSLKDNCSQTAPVIAFDTGNAAPNANYCYIPEFSRYYYIKDWQYNRGLWLAFMAVDVATSFRDYIASSRQYVLRSSKEWEGTIVDGLIPMKTRPYYSVHTNELGTNPFSPTLESGFYMVGIFNNDTGADGTVSYYAFTNAQFRAFCNNLMSTNFIDSFGVQSGELSSNLLKALFNPMQYIASCMWFPFAVPSGGAAISAIPFGFWSVTGNCKRAISTTKLVTLQIDNIARHPQSARGYFTRSAPFSKYKLIYPAFGTFELPPEMFYDATSIRLNFTVDLITGGGVMEISSLNALTNSWVSYVSVPVEIGVSVSISQLTQDLLGGAVSSVSTALSGAISGNVIGAAAGIVNAAVNSFVPQLTTFGGNGGRSAFIWGATVIAEFHELADDGIERFGKPLCAYRQLGALRADTTQPGYIQCANAEIEVPAYKDEKEMLKMLLERGFYLA